LEWQSNGTVPLFLFFFIWVWLLWFSRFIPSRFYRPFTADHTTTASIIIPVVDEPPQLFREVLAAIVAQQPHEVLVVINGRRNPQLEGVCAEFPSVRCTWIADASKRKALARGINQATGDICVLVDSDTRWLPNTLPELLKPFADPKVGGVTTHQRIGEPKRTVWTRYADWLEAARFSFGVPAQSVVGAVGVLPGRTIAFRRQLLLDMLPAFLNETFLGVHMSISDDRDMTMKTLRRGYRTVYQRSSEVLTDAPETFTRLVKQQYRWAKGSQYNTFRNWWFMARKTPLTCWHFSADILTPFFFVGVVIAFVWRLALELPIALHLQGTWLEPWWAQLFVALCSAVLGTALRQLPRLVAVPSDLIWLPVYTLVSLFVMMPIRIAGFMMAAIDTSWGTRPNAYQAAPPPDSPHGPVTA
jgi:hyaluronan synthase